MAVDPTYRGKLLAVNRKLDRLVVRYYRERFPQPKGAASGAHADR